MWITPENGLLVVQTGSFGFPGVLSGRILARHGWAEWDFGGVRLLVTTWKGAIFRLVAPVL